MATRVEAQAIERFDGRYRLCCREPLVEAEQEVLGATYGSSGYTTREQADELARCLALGPGLLLADLGAGAGWPGLYFAATTGCRVVGTDLAAAGLRQARARAAEDGVAGQAAYLVARGSRPPLRPGAFDAVVHTDVLCCLGPKLSVLRACRSLLRPGGRMAFTTIHLTPGLDPRTARRAVRAGPAQVRARQPYPEMVALAGFTAIEAEDLTPAYLATERAWGEALDRRADVIRPLLPEGELERRQADRCRALAAIEAGLLRRTRFTAMAR